VALGGSESSVDDVPHHLVVDRCFVHGHPGKNFKRGIALNSASSCVIGSHVSDYHSDFQDSQAIGGFNGPGPFRIFQNRLEGGAENIMFGGAVPAISGLVPAGIEIRGNHLFKPLAWRKGDPGNTGYTPWVKNLFELKNAKDVVFAGNLLENNWVGADQHGIAIVLTPRGEDGQVPWATVENVVIENNVIVNVGGAVGVLGFDTPVSQQATNLTLKNNLFWGIKQENALDIVRVAQFNEVKGLAFDHNTFVYGPGSWPFARTFGNPTTGFVYTNNIVEFREGLWAECGTNAAALACLLPGAVVDGNVFAGGNASDLPGNNSWPATFQEVGFVGSGSALTDWALAASSAYVGKATDGSNPGFDPAAYVAAGGPPVP
jgi:hypothetical protein